MKGLVTEDASRLNLNGSLCKCACTHVLSILVLVVTVIDRVNYMRDLCEDQ